MQFFKSTYAIHSASKSLSNYMAFKSHMSHMYMLFVSQIPNESELCTSVLVSRQKNHKRDKRERKSNFHLEYKTTSTT